MTDTLYYREIADRMSSRLFQNPDQIDEIINEYHKDASVYTICAKAANVLDIVKELSNDDGIVRLFNFCHPITDHPYLKQRGITEQVLRSSCFHERVFRDQFRNVVFPHLKSGIACGLELVNENMHLFVKGSEKTLWRSNRLSEDDALMLAEAPIDAISYEILHAFKEATNSRPPFEADFVQNVLLDAVRQLGERDRYSFWAIAETGMRQSELFGPHPENDIIPSFDMDSMDSSHIDLTPEKENKDKGKGLDI